MIDLPDIDLPVRIGRPGRMIAVSEDPGGGLSERSVREVESGNRKKNDHAKSASSSESLLQEWR